METREEIEEIVILKRSPPGDRWADPETNSSYPTLTHALDGFYNRTGVHDFIIYARRGVVCIRKVSVTHVEEVIERYSLYGEN